jgi:hypothetical protein
MIRRWQRELGVPAPLDDTAEARQDRGRPLMTDLQLSINRAVIGRLDALERKVDALEKQAARQALCECGCSFAAHDCLSDDMECLRCDVCNEYRPKKVRA